MAQQLLASGAKTVGDTVSGAVYGAADLVRSAGLTLPRFLDSPMAALAAQLPASLKQEMVCALLGVLAQHSSAALALQLPAGDPVEPPAVDDSQADAAGQVAGANGTAQEHQSAADTANAGSVPQPGSRPLLPPLVVPSSPRSLPLHPNAAAHGELQERTVLWLDAAVAALQAAEGCLHWEPLLPPPLPGQPPAPKLPAMQAVNLTTVPVDMWLQLLQGACAASRAVLSAHGHAGLKTIYRANGGRMLARLTTFDVDGALALRLEAACITLQALIQKVWTPRLTMAGLWLGVVRSGASQQLLGQYAAGLLDTSTANRSVPSSRYPLCNGTLPPHAFDVGTDGLAHSCAGCAATRPLGGGALPGASCHAGGHMVLPAGMRGGHPSQVVAAGERCAHTLACGICARRPPVQESRAPTAGGLSSSNRLLTCSFQHWQPPTLFAVASAVFMLTSCLCQSRLPGRVTGQRRPDAV